MRPTLSLFALFLAACERRQADVPRPPITVFAAASLARPLATVRDSFRAHSAIPSLVELGGSMDQVRKITDLGRVPDVLLLVDDDITAPLIPAHLDWYVRYATNRLVVAYTAKSRFADSINTGNWWRVLTRRDVTVGRADPDVAPVGKHALAMLRRAGTYYSQAGLSDRLVEHASLRFVRPNAAELAALLETGEVDYIIDYASVASQYGFSYVSVPDDLAPPVLYTASVPRGAPHFSEGIEFVTYYLTDDAKRLLRDAHVDVLPVPVAVGSVIPPEISRLVRTVSVAPPSSAVAVARAGR
ncbi:MAG TPA: substrate-binding domain-containing protein [Gemmatimonadaceae bacterium]|nr:substrate-binding domain-containing protein [Gemmatimonadaceae bacterium]